MAGNNLKTIITADTAQFKKGVKDAQNALKDFKKQGESALSGIEGVLGNSSGLFSTIQGNIRNATALIAQFGRSGGEAATGLRTAFTAVGGAIAGLGITAAITLFKQLNNEAANFEQRLQGVNLAAAANAARDTYRQSLYNQTGRGEDFAYTKEYWQTRLSMGWANMLTGANAEERDKAMQAAQRAADLARERVDIQRDLDQSIVGQAAMQARLNELTNKARDNSVSIAERSEAKASAETLINTMYDRQVMLQERLAANLRETNSIVSSTDEEMRQQYQAEAAVHNLEAQRQSSLRMLVRMGNTLANASKDNASSTKETQEATELTLEAATKLVEQQRALNALQTHNNAMMGRAREASLGWGRVSDPTLMLRALGANQATIKVPATIVPKVDGEAAEAAVLELSDIIADGVAGMSEALGGLIGDLINGENAWGNFAQAGISVVADMLSTVGKAFIAEGVGVMAAQKALTFGQGAGAVAAGAAMVALAATMKTAMSNAASSWGSGGYSSSVASSSYASSSAYGASAFGREMELKVTGTLTANGSKLVAVLNNENDRRSYTT